jgi:hypothetical protein
MRVIAQQIHELTRARIINIRPKFILGKVASWRLLFYMPVYLEFNESTSQFFETTRNTSDDTILLVIDEAQKKLIMTVPSGKTMITRRAAERQARGITKTGFLCNDGGRYGRDHELEILGEGGQLPDRLRESPREVY